jgi:iron-only hydrogenase group A
MINLTIDDQPISVPEGTTVMEAAETLGIHIPRLCYHPDLSLAGSCRVCIVDVKEMGFYMASCSVKVWEGMEVQTNSPEIRQARRDIVELLLDNHPRDCQTCERDGRCELQNMAYAMGVRERLFEGERKRFDIEASSRSVVRDSEKCILCGRCVRVCHEVQGVYNLSQQYRGFDTVVTPAFGADMDDSVCIQCGQCINVCPVAAFLEKDETDNVWAALADPEKHVVVQTAPSIRAAIGEGFDLDAGTACTGKMVTALRRLGFDAVFDTDLGADLTIVEESAELLRRLGGDGPLPIITSCSPGWISFMEKFYPALIPNASTCRSPMTMLSVLSKTYYAQKLGVDPHKVYMVSIMPCTAKKFEARRPEHYLDENTPYTDSVLTTRELIWMIKSYGIDFTRLPDGEFDAPLGISTGAGDIFGCTGGVMEATLRTAVQRVSDEAGQQLEFGNVRAVEGLREADVKVGDKTLHVGVANGLTNARVLLEKVLAGEKFDAIEVMACPGGCVGGGGQPYPKHGGILDPELLRLRAKALYGIDGAKQLRRSHENPALKELYEEFLGEIGGEKAHELLHTSYHPRRPRGINEQPVGDIDFLDPKGQVRKDTSHARK